MKKTFLIILLAGLFTGASAQLTVKTKCNDFVVDIMDGTVNGLKPNAQIADIKSGYPCFSSSDPEGGTSKCGATVMYKDRDVYFYTDRDYIEIGEKFKGKLTIPLMGAPRTGLFKWLGNPKLKDDTWEAYDMAFGTLVLHFNKLGKVNLIQFSTKATSVLSLCE